MGIRGVCENRLLSVLQLRLRQVSDTVVEPYNATLSVHQLVENADECMVSSANHVVLVIFVPSLRVALI